MFDTDWQIKRNKDKILKKWLENRAFLLEQQLPWLFTYFQSFKERNNIIGDYIFWLAV